MKTLFTFSLGVFLANAIVGAIFLVVGVVVLFSINTPLGAVLLLGGVALVATMRIRRNRGKTMSTNEQLWAGLTHQAYIFEGIAKAGFATTANFSLEAGEKLIAQVPGIELAEYKSGGSRYQGSNVGISVPVVGRVRANIGGSHGQLVRNPEQLTVIDTGSIAVTTQRVIFTGAAQTRVFELGKILNFDVGFNGMWVTISTSNKTTTSTLQTNDFAALGPGSLLDIAMDAHNVSETEGLEKTKAYAELLRQTVAEAQAAKR